MAAVNFTRCDFRLRSNSTECFALIGQFHRAISQSGNHRPPHFSCAMDQTANSSRQAHIALKSTDKFKLLNYLRHGINQTAASKKYGIDRSPVPKNKRNEPQIRSDAQRNKQTDMKRARQSRGVDVETALLCSFRQMRGENVPINKPMLLEKAHSLAIQLNSDFQPNPSWLERLKKHENNSFQKLHDEKRAADTEGAESWKTQILPSIVEGYEPHNIFNVDEPGLFYKATPTGSLVDKGEERSGIKIRRECLTFLMIVNQSGTEKKIITIGKFPNRRCFRNKAPPLQYYSNKKAWMTSEIWETIITKFSSKMQPNGCNILLFCDNASCHKLNYEVSSTKLIFMPSNTTSLIQLLDQGIIRTVKVYYRTQLIRQMVIAIDNGAKPDDFARSISVLKAIYMLKRAFVLVTPSTIYKCFRKADFVLHVLRQKEREIEEINIPEANPPEEFTTQEFNEFPDIDSGE